MTTYKKISALVLENAFTELQIRAYRVNELRNKQKLVNVSIVALSNKKKISVQVENLERLLDSFNNMMDTIENEIYKVDYIRSHLDSLLHEAERCEVEITNALIELTLSVD